ncbi:O-antigen ligase family protein [Hydrogenophaga palleronii]|uniref:O-antigen ligase family protein n=1 Tax=Hydrogenophaga palleronii TaxID=65655 RepID=UPI0008249199|nr:O-antigen ligase family protein [Hydrogenophaga palleronii]
MIQDLKTLAIVLTLGSLAFIVGKRFWLQVMSQEDFRLRRNAWFGLTILAFLSPSFLLFCLIAAPILVWLGQRDSNPLALYVLLLHIIPPVSVYIPLVGAGYLIDFNNYRLLTLTVLLPYAWKLMHTRQTEKLRQPGLGLPYFLIFCFSALQIIQLIPLESLTNTFRRLLLVFLDSILLVYAFSRGASSEQKIREILGTCALIMAVAAPIAMFESLRGWLMYENVVRNWGIPMDFAFLMRGNSLRAQASTGHALVLGYMTAIAFGVWLYLARYLKVSKFQLIAGSIWFWVGLIAAYSRAPWLTAVLIPFVFVFLLPRGMIQAIKMGILATIGGSVILALPLGGRIVASLPFIGTIDTENVTYRQRLAEASWDLVMQYPVFGTPRALEYLEHLRQGQGIIDLVNVYATVAVFHGLVGLSLFCGYFLISLFRTWSTTALFRKTDPAFSSLGACLVALLLGTYFFMATGSFGTGLAQMAWILSALGLAYARLQPSNNNSQSNA